MQKVWWHLPVLAPPTHLCFQWHASQLSPTRVVSLPSLLNKWLVCLFSNKNNILFVYIFRNVHVIASNVSCRHPYICQCCVIDGLLPLWFPSPDPALYPEWLLWGGTFLPLLASLRLSKKPSLEKGSVPCVTALDAQMESLRRMLSLCF